MWRAGLWSPLLPARCAHCGYSLQFHSMLFGMIHLLFLAAVLAGAVLWLKACR